MHLSSVKTFPAMRLQMVLQSTKPGSKFRACKARHDAGSKRVTLGIDRCSAAVLCHAFRVCVWGLTLHLHLIRDLLAEQQQLSAQSA